MSDSEPAPIVTVITTAPTVETAEAIGRTLVSERLAACANVLPGVTSIFRWDGELRRDTEAMVILKTTEGCVPALERRVVALHPYDVPEVIVLPVKGGHAPYLTWVDSEVVA